MGSLTNKMKAFIADEQGAETVEWVVVVALVIVVTIAIYQGILQTQLLDAVTKIGTKINAL